MLGAMGRRDMAPRSAQSPIHGRKGHSLRRHRTGKATLTWRRGADAAWVVEKTVTSEDPCWQERLSHEAEVVRFLQAADAPFRFARLLEDRGSTLVHEALPGRALSRRRYPTHLPAGTTSRCIVLADSVASVTAPRALTREDPASRLATYVERGYARGQHASVAQRLIEQCDLAFAHGDFRASNILMSGHHPGLVDWEFGGLHPRGYDLATLWVHCLFVPASRRCIESALAARSIQERRSFWLSAYLVAMREAHIHQRDVPTGHSTPAIVAMHREVAARMTEVATRGDSPTVPSPRPGADPAQHLVAARRAADGDGVGVGVEQVQGHLADEVEERVGEGGLPRGGEGHRHRPKEVGVGDAAQQGRERRGQLGAPRPDHRLGGGQGLDRALVAEA